MIGTRNAIYLGSHVILGQGGAGLYFDAAGNRAGIEEIVKGLVEAARVAYNASEYPDGASDSTLVPKSCILYLDNAVNHLLCEKYGLRRWAGIDGSNTWYHSPMGAEFKDGWLDCMIFLRSIRNQYCDIIPDANGAVESELGTPFYALTSNSRREIW
jgi:hypothetical protein